MKKFLNAAILITTILSLAYGVIAFGAVTLETAAPLFVGGMLLAVFWALKLLSSDRVSWISSPLHLPVLLFLGYTLIRYFTSPIERDSRIELFHVALYATIYFAVACNLYHRRDLTLIFLAIMVLAIGEAGYGLWQFASKSNVVLFAERPASYQGRASGTFVNPNHFAGFLSTVLGLLLARILLHRPAVKATFGTYAGPKIVEGYATLVVLAGIVTSGSRGSWLAVTLTMLAFIIWAWFPGAVSKTVVGILTGIVAIALIVVLSVPLVQNRIKATVSVPTEKGSKVDFSFNQRSMLWSSSLRIIGEHPLFGSGPGTWEWFQAKHRDSRMQMDPVYAHSDLLQLTADYGLIGLGLIVFALVCYFRQVAHLSNFANFSDQRAFAVGSAFAVAAVLVHSLADFHFHIPANAVMIMLLIALAVAMERGEGSSRRVQMARTHQFSVAAVLLIGVALAGWFGTRLYNSQHNLSIANDFKQHQLFDEALPKYQKSLEWDGHNYAAYRGIGDIYLRMGQTMSGVDIGSAQKDFAQRALEAYDKASELNRFDAETWAGKAYAHALAGDPVKAEEMFNQALAMDPNNSTLWLRIGVFYRAAGEDKKAIEAFTKSLAMKFEPSALANLEALRQKQTTVN